MINDIRIGHGYDVHRLVPERKLILGGTEIPYELGLLGHSDADVLLHAVMDSVLGAIGKGDIGLHFPDSDDKYLGISSMKLAEEVYNILNREGYSVSNIDATVIAQKPKIMPYINDMKINIASVFHIPEDRVNIKATTEENLGFTGRLEGISAHCVCVVVK